MRDGTAQGAGGNAQGVRQGFFLVFTGLGAQCFVVALSRWHSHRFSACGQDRLMQDILDRGLGSEDRKTLRKLASVGGMAAISHVFADSSGGLA